jgi:hypothetical protein
MRNPVFKEFITTHLEAQGLIESLQIGLGIQVYLT